MTETKEKKKIVQKTKPAKKEAVSKNVKKTVKQKLSSAKSSKKEKTEEEVVPRLRIRVRAYEYRILDASVQQIMDTALRFDVNVRGPVPLPTEIKKYSVNRASFVYSKSKEQFEIRIHKRLIDIVNPTQKVIESLTNMNLPSGVSIEVKTI